MTIKTLALAIGAATLATAALAQNAPLVNGTIEKVDAAAEKISIHHEAIPNLGMDGDMTMIFKAGDKTMLTAAKPGEKVQFTAERVNGQITVTKIQKAK
jgi:Cu(I)/Ag(I) efflux system protein CusF